MSQTKITKRDNKTKDKVAEDENRKNNGSNMMSLLIKHEEKEWKIPILSLENKYHKEEKTLK